MAKNETGRPEWFKFWRRHREMIDHPDVSLEARGIILTNILRYFDQDTKLLEMDALQNMVFRTIKVNIDEAFDNYELRSEVNTANGKKGGRPKKNQVGFEETEKTKPVFKKTNETEKTRRQKTEDRSEKTETEGRSSLNWGGGI